MQAAETLSEYELERGKPMPSWNHAEAQFNLLMALAPYRDKFSIKPELSLDLGGKPLTPDVCLFPPLGVDWLHDQVRTSEPPLMVVEILSPTQAMDDLIAKADIYFKAGVKSCWMVLPALKSIAVLVPDRDLELFSQGEVVDPATQVKVAVADVFR